MEKNTADKKLVNFFLIFVTGVKTRCDCTTLKCFKIYKTTHFVEYAFHCSFLLHTNNCRQLLLLC